VEQKSNRRGLLTHGTTRSSSTGTRISTRGTSTTRLDVKVRAASNRLRHRLDVLRRAKALTTCDLEYKFMWATQYMGYPFTDRGYGILLNYRHYY